MHIRRDDCTAPRKGGCTFVPIPTAPTRLIHSFDDIARPALERIQTSQQELPPLAAIRNTLLPKFISGEVRVKAAEISRES